MLKNPPANEYANVIGVENKNDDNVVRIAIIKMASGSPKL